MSVLDTVLLFVVAQVIILITTFWRIETTRRQDRIEGQREQIEDIITIILAPELRDIDRRLSNIEGQLGARSRSQ
jgi:hypothetical protein